MGLEKIKITIYKLSSFKIVFQSVAIIILYIETRSMKLPYMHRKKEKEEEGRLYML